MKTKILETTTCLMLIIGFLQMNMFAAVDPVPGESNLYRETQFATPSNDRGNVLSKEVLDYIDELSKESGIKSPIITNYYLGKSTDNTTAERILKAKQSLDYKKIQKIINSRSKDDIYAKELSAIYSKSNLNMNTSSSVAQLVTTLDNLKWYFQTEVGAILITTSASSSWNISGHAEIITNKTAYGRHACDRGSYYTIFQTASAWSGKNSYLNGSNSLCVWANMDTGGVYIPFTETRNTKWNAGNNAATWLQGRPYGIGLDKWNTNTLYCSQLVWRAYIEARGYRNYFDLDSNGGFFVTPEDLRRSPQLISPVTWSQKLSR